MKEVLDLLMDIKDENIEIIKESANYVDLVLRYGHIALFSGILEIDLEKAKKGFSLMELEEINKIIDEAVELNRKYDDNAFLKPKMIMENVYSDFAILNREIEDKYTYFNEKMMSFVKKYLSKKDNL